MSPLAGLAFLGVGLAVFALGVGILALRERFRHAPGRTVHHFQRSRSAMRKLYRAQLARREAARARARAAHPTSRRRTRRSA